MRTISSITIATLLATFLLAPAKIGLSYSGGLSNAEIRRLAALHQAGVSGDQSQVEVMRNIVRNPYAFNNKFAPFSINELLEVSALRSLTRLNATAAIPDFDLLRQQAKGYPDLENFAVVQEARLKSEQEASTAPNFQTQIVYFCKALGLSLGEINAGAAAYKKQYYASPEGRRLPLPVEVYAMRELADIAYQGQAQDFLSMPGMSQVDFSLDYPSALKIRLASLPKDARVKALIALLATARVLSTNEDYAMQLLADEGPAASPTLAAQLQTMRQHRDQYQQINFSAFFRVLEATGDANQSAVVAQFQQDPDVNVKREAEVISHNLSSGSASIFPRAAGY